MPPAQKPTGAEDAESALTREQPVTAAAVTPTPVNNESAGAEGAEFIAQDLSQDPPGNDDLLAARRPAQPAEVLHPHPLRDLLLGRLRPQHKRRGVETPRTPKGHPPEELPG